MSDLENEVPDAVPDSSPEVAHDAPSEAGGGFRSSIAEAFEAKEAEEGTATSAPAKGAESQSTRARDATGKFATATKAKVVPGVASATKAPQSSSQASVAAPKSLQGDATSTVAAPVQSADPMSKAPPSWKPLAVEKWESLPPEVKAEVHRVDTEVKQAMMRASVAHNENQAFRKAWAPYEASIRADGVDPATATANLFQAYGTLRNGSAQSKAQFVASIIAQNGVDIQMLSQALSGQPAQDQRQQTQPQYRDPRVDDLINQWQQASQQTQVQQYQSALQSVEDWGKDKEFFQQVRGTMGDLRELHASKGKNPTLDQLYAMALLDPEHSQIQQVMEQRKAAEAAKATNAMALRGRQAASSIRSSPVAPMSRAKPVSMRDELAANFEALGGDR